MKSTSFRLSQNYSDKKNRMKGLLTGKEEEVVMVKSKEGNKGHKGSMLRVVEEVASWPSIQSLEEEYRREEILGSGR